MTYKPRIAIYGRHPTAKPAATSSSDQSAASGKLVDLLGGKVRELRLDHELSGDSCARPEGIGWNRHRD